MLDPNTVYLVGCLVRRPFVAKSKKGLLVGLFTVRHDYSAELIDGGIVEETTFVPCKVVGSNARSLSGRKEGDRIHIQGTLRTETRVSKRAWQSYLVLLVESFHFGVKIT
jgi:single-stranded DNA-binding protein